jgi:hypothetical protein
MRPTTTLVIPGGIGTAANAEQLPCCALVAVMVHDPPLLPTTVKSVGNVGIALLNTMIA